MSKIIGITNVTKQKILNKSAKSLPDRPSASGYSAEQIRRAFFEPIINKDMQDNEDNPSLVSEVNRIVAETNEAIEKANTIYISAGEPTEKKENLIWLEIEEG